MLGPFPAWQRKKILTSGIKLVEFKKGYLKFCKISKGLLKMFVYSSVSNWMKPPFLRETFDLFALSELRPSAFEAFQSSFGLLDIIFWFRYIEQQSTMWQFYWLGTLLQYCFHQKNDRIVFVFPISKSSNTLFIFTKESDNYPSRSLNAYIKVFNENKNKKKTFSWKKILPAVNVFTKENLLKL